MGRRRDPNEPLGCYCGVIVFENNAIPDMFVWVAPDSEWEAEVYLSARTWSVLHTPGTQTLAAFLAEVPNRRDGWALAGPPFDLAAQLCGVRRRLHRAA